MKIKHHSLFKNLNSERIDWNYIRNDLEENQYFIPYNKSLYIKNANQDKSHDIYIREILGLINRYKIKSVFSIGSGRGHLEYKLKKNNLNVTISDKDESIERIKRFKIFDKVYKSSFLEITPKLQNYNGLLIISRIDTEIEDYQLNQLFKSLAKCNVKYIFFIPAQLLNLKSFLIEIWIRIKCKILMKKMVYCGYTRSENLFKKFWRRHYKTIKLRKNIYFLKLL
tara:strand:+ start:155 stop:829 length:675 start_codon:yes stop_codon:yes gene_type:complete